MKQLGSGIDQIDPICISVPDYYLDLLIYSKPESTAEAMFSLEYNVAYALRFGSFSFSALQHQTVSDPKTIWIRDSTEILSRKPKDADIVYDSSDPDIVEVRLKQGKSLVCEVGHPTASPGNQISPERLRAKFDECLIKGISGIAPTRLWNLLLKIDEVRDMQKMLTSVRTGAMLKS